MAGGIFMGIFSLIRINRAPMIYDHILRQNKKEPFPVTMTPLWKK